LLAVESGQRAEEQCPLDAGSAAQGNIKQSHDLGGIYRSTAPHTCLTLVLLRELAALRGLVG